MSEERVIAVAAEDDRGLEGEVGAHFGRCPYFAFVDVDECDVKAVEVVDNPYYTGHQPGQVPGFINQKKANVMLSGGMGGRAIQFFQQYGIAAATGATGTVRTALESYLGGELIDAAPCKESMEHGQG